MKNKIWIITNFPELYDSFKEVGVVGKSLAGERGHSFELNLVQIRNYSPKGFKGVDDTPFGGGQGMVVRADVLKSALEDIISQGDYGANWQDKLKIIYTGPRGEVWSNKLARDFANNNWRDCPRDLVFVSGRYEGIDERFIEKYVDQVISIGDYVLSGGDLAVMVILDCALRFVPGVLGKKVSFEDESFEGGLLEHPHYTRPREFEGEGVPEVLLSGNHKLIEDYRRSERERITRELRPDLWKKYKDKNG